MVILVQRKLLEEAGGGERGCKVACLAVFGSVFDGKERRGKGVVLDGDEQAAVVVVVVEGGVVLEEADVGGVAACGGGWVDEEEIAEGEMGVGVAGGGEEVDAGADAGGGRGGFLAAHCWWM